MNLRVKIKRLKDVELPKYAKPGDAGFDLVAAEDVIIGPGETRIVPTGLAFEIPPGYELQIRPRSGISARTKLRVILGTIDSGYRDGIGIIVENTATHSDFNDFTVSGLNGDVIDTKYPVNEEARIVQKGDRIAQGVIAPVETAHFVEVDELSESRRGKNGFGSTGVK
jgi:dUTP pyrophosphatase